MGFLKQKQLPEDDEKELRRLAWVQLRKHLDYEALVLSYVDAYEVGARSGFTDGYLKGLEVGIGKGLETSDE